MFSGIDKLNTLFGTAMFAILVAYLLFGFMIESFSGETTFVADNNAKRT
jgi:hypothetical protein